MKDIKVSVVVANWNGKALLEKNLPYLRSALSNKTNQILEVVIVDDASKDDSCDFIKNNFPEFRLIKHKVNRSFLATANTGVKNARGNLVAILNNDVAVSSNFLEKALPQFEDEFVFAVSFHEKGFGWAKGKFVNGFFEHEPGGEATKATKTFWVSGGSGVFRRDIFIKLGGFDEKLLSPFYWDDIDICYRALKRGYKLIWEPGCHVVHEHEATISTKNYKKRRMDFVKERNQLIFIWKNITSSKLTREHTVALIKRVLTHPGYMKIVFGALSKLRDVVKARRKETDESKVSDEAIFASFK